MSLYGCAHCGKRGDVDSGFVNVQGFAGCEPCLTKRLARLATLEGKTPKPADLSKPMTYRELMDHVLPGLAPDSLDRAVRLKRGPLTWSLTLMCYQDGTGPVFELDMSDGVIGRGEDT
jgi:hypothetical protein